MYQSADGRVARRSRNREAVLDAMIALFSQDQLSPGVEEVAQLSGVSLRSVYRYFSDMDTLRIEAIQRNAARMEPLFALDCPGEGTLCERTERFAVTRMRLYDAGAATMRAALATARRDQLLAARVGLVRERLLRQILEMFEPELRLFGSRRRKEVAVMADIVSGFEALERLRVDSGFSRQRTLRLVSAALESTLGVNADSSFEANKPL